MASNVNLHDIDIEDIGKLSVVILKDVLKCHKQSAVGKKEVLVARTIALKSRLFDQTPDTDGYQGKQSPFVDILDKSDILYDDIYKTAQGRVWTDDLRKLCECNFHQLYDYLVVKTLKLNNEELKGSSYKKLKSYCFFAEGNISNVEVCRDLGYVWVKAKVLASMKKTQYRVIVVFKSNGDVNYAACQCPAGLGINGAGKCNHIGGVLFAVNSFTSHKLQQHQEKVSCTSKINGWIVPRNLNVDPKPIINIAISRKKLGEEGNQFPEESVYDPRAPQDRLLDVHSRNTLYDELMECAPSSGFFLFYKNDEIEPTPTSTEVNDFALNEITISSTNSISKSPPRQQVPTLPIPLIEKNLNIADNEINETFIETFVEPIIVNNKVSDIDIKQVEEITRGQSTNTIWKTIHKYKATASNFGKMIKCRKNPDGLLKSMFYTNVNTAAMNYGQINEAVAIKAYKEYMMQKGSNVQIEPVGIILSKTRPGFGASLDSIVNDPLEAQTHGGLEVKCPYSKLNMDISTACADKSFFLKSENGMVSLKTNHNYFYQVQGQMFVANLEWVDIVVWFGAQKDIFVERVFFDSKRWNEECLPKLDLFYKWAVVPELLTRRVERQQKLVCQDMWKKLIAK